MCGTMCSCPCCLNGGTSATPTVQVFYKTNNLSKHIGDSSKQHPKTPVINHDDPFTVYIPIDRLFVGTNSLSLPTNSLSMGMDSLSKCTNRLFVGTNSLSNGTNRL